MISRMKPLILDSSLATIETLKDVLVEVGFTRELIASTRSYSETSELLSVGDVDFFMTDFLMEGRPCLELASELLDKKPSAIVVIVTYNNSSAAIADAAEELVDDYIIKPLQAEAMVQRLKTVIERKLFPSKYAESIQRGKTYLSRGDFAAAQLEFQNASFLNETPTLAYYYLGLASFQQKEFQKAHLDFERGLSVKPLHFRCLTGQFDAFFEQKKFDHAYAMVPQLVDNYPMGPKRLCNLFVAAVYSGRLDEVPKYFELFQQIEHVTPELRRVFSAALYVAGKFHLNRQQLQEAIAVFENGLSVAGADENYIDKVVRTLVASGPFGVNASIKFMKRYPSQGVGGMKHANLQFLLDQYRRPRQELIEAGRQLAQKNWADADSLKILIQALNEDGRTLMAEQYAHIAAKLSPEGLDKV